jgi:hypothetical protein
MLNQVTAAAPAIRDGRKMKGALKVFNAPRSIKGSGRNGLPVAVSGVAVAITSAAPVGI